MQAPKFAQFAVSVKPGMVGGEVDHCEGTPKVFSEGGWNGLFAQVGKLIHGIFVL